MKWAAGWGWRKHNGGCLVVSLKEQREPHWKTELEHPPPSTHIFPTFPHRPCERAPLRFSADKEGCSRSEWVGGSLVGRLVGRLTLPLLPHRFVLFFSAFIEIIILIIGNKQRDPDGPRKCQWYYVQHNICCIYGAKSMKVGGWASGWNGGL